MTLQIAPGFNVWDRKQFIVYGGGKGGGGGGGQQGPMQTTSTVNQSNLPEYARPYYESLMQRAQQTSNDPYQAYGGPRVAQFTDQQNQAFQQVNQNQGSWKPAVDQAQQTVQNATFNPGQVNNTYQAQQFTPSQWTDQGVAQSYMSPYQQNVTDIAKREAFRDYNIQQQQRNSQAQQAGAFGGYRQGLVQAEAERNLNQQLQDIQDRGLQNAYQTGIGAYNQDRSALMGANQMNNQNFQQQSQLGMAAAGANNQYGLQAAGQQLQQGQALAGLGQLRQGLGQQDINSLYQAGGMQQAQQQQLYDTAYQDFLSQRDYNRQNLNWLSGILRGVPTTANSSVVGYQAPPSQISQIAGLGLGAAGLAKMLG